MADGQKSIGWVVVALAITVAVFGWGFMAGAYAGSVEGFRPELGQTDRGTRRNAAMAEFIGNATRQIPNAPAVLADNFKNRTWLPVTILILEGVVVAAGLGMKALERSLEGPPKRRRRR